ncbi:hypothetical protein Are01nite_77680 [Actinoplanes regularis]|nr:hypothetical protein Are01nite_77680 [Actinoplanes regularis]
MLDSLMTEKLGDGDDLGFGVGLRPELVDELLAPDSGFDFLEAITEDYLTPDEQRRDVLDRLAERYPIVLHGLSLSIGGVDPLDLAYLRGLRELADGIGARWVSDHLCWTGVDGVRTHELLPLPRTRESLAHVTSRVLAAQDVLGRPLVLENAAAYLGFDESTMPEPEFLGLLVEATGCRLLLDVNNVHVSASNLGFDPTAYLDALPAGAVVQIHLAGSRDMGAFLLDTHDDRVSAPVWELYEHACRRLGPVSTSFEWDSGVPSLALLREELRTAAELRARVGPRPPRPPSPAVAPPIRAGADARRLADRQRALQLAILDGTAQQAVPGGETVLRPLSHGEGIAVYGSAYRARHLDLLRTAYPVLGELIGDDLDDLALDYLASAAGRGGDLDEFVSGFAGWVTGAFRDRPGAAAVRDVLTLETALAELGGRSSGEARFTCLGAPGHLRSLAIRAGVLSGWTGEPGAEVALVRRDSRVSATFLGREPASADPSDGGA